MPKRLIREPGQLDIVEWFTGKSAKRHANYDISLCGPCNEIKVGQLIDDIMRQKHTLQQRSTLFLYNIGYIKDWSTSCPLCHLFRSIALRDESRLHDDFQLVLLCRRSYVFSQLEPYAILEAESPLLGVTSTSLCASPYSQMEDAYISWMTTSAPTNLPSQGKLIDMARVDFELINSWIEFCQEHHTRNCATIGATAVQGLQVIDCKANIVVPATHRTEYLALSYVWGTKKPVEAMEGHKLIWAKLPQTVRDAISTTKRFGYRYLWVDRYCIPPDPKLKHAQIMSMDIIYKQAIATIVAAAGKDADFGLVGAGVRSRLKQPLAKVGTYTLFSTLPHPRSTIASSVWASRGWTYQEALLSKRKIFFLGDQVYYECDGMQCCEALPPDLKQWHTDEMQEFHASVHSLEYGLSAKNLRVTDVWGYIALYTSRQLTYDGDALNGMLGIFAYLETPESTFRQLWGIPITLKYTSTQKSNSSRWLPTHCFLRHLTWKYRSTSSRRVQFPSWSWTGWRGSMYLHELKYDGCSCAEVEERTMTVVGAEGLDMNLISWEQLYASLSSRIDQRLLPRTIVIEGWTMQLKFRHLRPPKHMMGKLNYYAYADIDEVNFRYMTLVNCTAYAELHLNGCEQNMKERLGKESFTGLWMQCADKSPIGEVIVLDQRSDGGYERIGTTNLTSGTMLNAILKWSYCCSKSSDSHSLERFPCACGRNLGNRLWTQYNTTFKQWKLEREWRQIRLC